MKPLISYKLKKVLIENQEIILKNNSDSDKLCRVVINRELFKIVYLAPFSEETLEYSGKEIESIEVLDISDGD
ncbi:MULTISPECIES: hypothetical protein [Streptococcus]|uniref:hypothetical protein n=1 Tax=Streptococcus TaxID=1301 RepID=UPI000CF5D0C2|nr:hypothetical protein [Streptococcus suis]MDY5444630.1 hypothetical protein [Lactobacillus amylovorus]BCP62940.1 hypothetical protein SUT380_21280 [Streptococcus parasuis]